MYTIRIVRYVAAKLVDSSWSVKYRVGVARSACMLDTGNTSVHNSGADSLSRSPLSTSEYCCVSPNVGRYGTLKAWSTASAFPEVRLNVGASAGPKGIVTSMRGRSPPSRGSAAHVVGPITSPWGTDGAAGGGDDGGVVGGGNDGGGSDGGGADGGGDTGGGGQE
eukprot:4261997-Prymnesium_polylepis.1